MQEDRICDLTRVIALCKQKESGNSAYSNVPELPLSDLSLPVINAIIAQSRNFVNPQIFRNFLIILLTNPSGTDKITSVTLRDSETVTRSTVFVLCPTSYFSIALTEDSRRNDETFDHTEISKGDSLCHSQGKKS